MLLNKSLSGVLSIFIYFLTILPFFSYNSPFYIWLSMEMNALAFLYMAYVTQSSMNLDHFSHDNYFMYFKIQSLASFVFLGSVFFHSLNNSSFVNNQDLGVSILALITVSSIAMKMGIPPFHQWTYKFCSSQLSVISIFTFLTFQKLILFGVMMSFSLTTCVFYSMVGLVSGSVLVYSSNSLMDLMVSSSIFNSFWFFVFFMFSFQALTLFYFFYSLSTWYFSILSKKSSDSFMPSLFSLGGAIMSFMMMALPPFSTFFMKTVILFIFSTFFSVTEILFISFFMFVGLCSYLKYFYHFYLGKISFHESNLSVGFYYIVPLSVYVFLFF